MTLRSMAVSAPVRYGLVMRTLLFVRFALLAALFAPAPALAGETPWQELAPGSRMRVVSDDAVDAAGRTWLALEIELAPGTNTYWSLPGETGIPIVVALEGGGAEIAEIVWPYPTREDGPYLDYVYYERLVLPMAVEGAVDGERAALEVRLGLCADLCVPVSASFEHRFSLARQDLAQTVRIAQAKALAPLEWPAGSGAVASGLAFADGTLTLAGLHADIAPQSAILELAGTQTLFDAPAQQPDDSLAFALLDGDADAISEGALRLTFLTEEGAYWAWLPAVEAHR